MLIMRFKAQCRPEKTEETLAAYRAVIAPGRAVEGVVMYDIARELSDLNAMIGVGVFEDQDALDRLHATPEARAARALINTAFTGPPEYNVWTVQG